MLLDKNFWKNCPNHAVLAVALLTEPVEFKPSYPLSEMGDPNQEEADATDEIARLDHECRNLESKIEFLKRRN